MADDLPAGANPYVGPRTFMREDRERFFGREREARELLSLVISQRLVLFYAQSGAGKSSLINTRLAPQLGEAGFVVLPVARVGGELPASVAAADNVFLFNLMLSLDQSQRDPNRLAHLNLADFLARLTSDDGEHYTYDEALEAAPSAAAVTGPTPAGEDYAEPNYVLIIDQFEEIFTAHLGRWGERAAFFQQLDAALRADPRLWVVLTLREDYVAGLDPYAPLLTDKLRARYYMERMEKDAALEAVKRPAELGGRPFAPGVAEALVDNLRRVRVPGQAEPQPGQYVEPVQLQVVCYQLWERLQEAGVRSQRAGDGGQESGSRGQEAAGRRFITEADLAEAGDVDRALTQFYEETLAAALADPAVAGVNERQLRTWFDQELITEAGTRGLVRQSQEETSGLPNDVVRALQRRFLVRGEARGGDTWIELVHDRFVEPIRASNAAWFPQHLSALQRQAALWAEQRRSSGLLLRDAALTEAEKWADDHADELQPIEQEFLAACREARERAKREQQQYEREQRLSRRNRILAIAAGIVAILAIAAAIWGWDSSRKAAASAVEAGRQKQVAEDNAQKAVTARATADASADEAKRQKQLAEANEKMAVAAQATAEANAQLAQAQLDRQAGLALLQEAYALKGKGDGEGAIEKLRVAKATKTDLGIDVDAEIEDVRRQVATRLVREGEVLAKGGDFPAAEAKFKAAQNLNPPSDTSIYIWIEPGAFVMGSLLEYEDEKPPHNVWVDGFWIQSTEVTNGQYARCVRDTACEPPHNTYWGKPQYSNIPVTHVDWFQANDYANWVGGRLPTEAEWEKACHGTDNRIFSWGNNPLSPSLANITESGFPLPSVVGSYPPGAYNLYDMSGNVWEWTSTLDWPYPYVADDGRDSKTDIGDRVLRGGAFNHEGNTDFGVSCTVRGRGGPYGRGGYYGFRTVASSPTK